MSRSGVKKALLEDARQRRLSKSVMSLASNTRRSSCDVTLGICGSMPRRVQTKGWIGVFESRAGLLRVTRRL